MDVDNRIKYVGGVIASVVVLQLLWSTFFSTPDIAAILTDIGATDKLVAHSDEFNKPEVIKVHDGVYMAIGYGIANSIMLEGPEGLVIVDVTESVESGREVYKELRQITKKPVKALIYTHNHADHVFGAQAFVEDSDGNVPVWAHHTILKHLKRVRSVVNPITFKRAMRQFGPMLPHQINAGIGYRLRYHPGTDVKLIYPTDYLYEDKMEISVAGLNLTLIHIPGETADQIGVWIEKTKTLLCADDFYRAFPNLYAIRGTLSRDLLDWVSSLDKMRNMKPEYLVPSHTRPVKGADNIFKLLTEYRDAIQFVHDQTVRYMNQGLFPNEIVEKIKLPKHLQENPYLIEFYGTVEWSVRGVFNTYMGWFSGDPVDLNPLKPLDKARHMAVLAGGVRKLITSAQNALDTDDAQWALELSSYVLRLEPHNNEALKIQTLALKQLASSQTSANGWNYYVTYAFEQNKLINTKAPFKRNIKLLKAIALVDIFKIMSRKLKAEEAEGINVLAAFEFTDENLMINMHVRNGIAEVTSGLKDGYDIKVTTTGEIWRELLSKDRSALTAYATGAISIDGGAGKLKNFMNLFES